MNANIIQLGKKKVLRLTSAGDIVVGQHSPYLTLADWQVGVRVPLTVV